MLLRHLPDDGRVLPPRINSMFSCRCYARHPKSLAPPTQVRETILVYFTTMSVVDAGSRLRWAARSREVAVIGSSQTTVIRPLTRTHLAGLLGVVNADALPGQPRCSVGALHRATGLRTTDSRVGAAPGRAGAVRDWQALVAVGDEVLGAVCFGRGDGGRAGTISWLHAREDPAVVSDLLDQAVKRLSGCGVIEAFVAEGIEPLVVGLPDNREVTRAALAERGFTGRRAGRFLYRALQTLPPAAGGSCAVRVTALGNQRHLSVAGPAGDQIAEATISVLAPGHGLVDWIEVHPDHRGKGLGGRLLIACLRLLHHLGVRQVIGYLDDHNLDADDGHGRIGAHIVSSRAGFVTGAQLTTYRWTR